MDSDAKGYRKALFERGLKECFTVSCDTETQARSLRNELYQYRSEANETARQTYSAVSFRIEGNNLHIGLAEQMERKWVTLP